MKKITTTDIFETKIGKFKSTANKIMENLEKNNIITQQENPLLRRKEKKRTPTSTASRPPGYPGTVQPKK